MTWWLIVINIREEIRTVFKRIHEKIKEVGKKEFVFLWSLLLLYFLVEIWHPRGPWYADYRYRLIPETSFSVALAILWVAPLLLILRPRLSWKKILGFMLIPIGLSLFVFIYYHPENRLKRALRQTARIEISHRSFDVEDKVPDSNEITFYINSIDNKPQITNLASMVDFTDPPWRHCWYFCKFGDFEFRLIDKNNKEITTFETVNWGTAVLWRDELNSDRHTSKAFQKELKQLFFSALPEDNGLSLPEEEAKLNSFFTYLWPCEESVRRLASISPHVKEDHRRAITNYLGSTNMPDTAATHLLALSKDENPKVRESAFWGLSNFRHLSTVDEYIENLDPASEIDPSVQEAMRRVQKITVSSGPSAILISEEFD